MVANPWLLLIHQIPHKPNYLRVKIWRRLQGLGAMQVKSSVYLLPRSEQALEDLQWVLREIVAGKGEASLCEARFVDGLTDEQLTAQFRSAREADYAELAKVARGVADSIPKRKKLDAKTTGSLGTEVERLRRRLAEILAIDFFGAPGREAVEGVLKQIDVRLREGPAGEVTTPRLDLKAHRGRTWVTREHIHVDRIASAWLIRRFIDPKARFKYVAGKGYVPKKDELRFDMFEAEFTHEGDRCTFEVLVDRFGLRDRSLDEIAEIVHDIDVKDGKFGRTDAGGVEVMIRGIGASESTDERRLARGSTIFEDLYTYFKVAGNGSAK
jgi:hypothetical protein